MTPQDLRMRDDGTGGDELKGDGIYSLGPLRYHDDTLATHYEFDVDSPRGLSLADLGNIMITTASGTRYAAFLVHPHIGILDQEIETEPVLRLSGNISLTSNIIAVQSRDHYTQRYLRGEVEALHVLTKQIYPAIGDQFDFLVFAALDHLENPTEQRGPRDFSAGAHTSVRVDFEGTGHTPRNHGDQYGSDARLAAITVLDTLRRGFKSNNLVHEILHHWGGRTPLDLEIQSDATHYDARSSVGSLLGGLRWEAHPTGNHILRCYRAGRNGASEAAPLDLYMMGLIPGRDVPDIHVMNGAWQESCDQEITDIRHSVSIDALQARLGRRRPAPSDAQRHFRIGFVIETHQREMTDAERTFYTIMAKHVTQTPVHQERRPWIGFNWAPIGPYFGHRTTWKSDIEEP